jgi:hypothetical protein
MPLNDNHIRSLLVAVRETHADEIDCEQFLGAMAPYAEARAAGGPLAPALAKAEAHERLCANCAEELQALVELLQAEKHDAG